MAATTHLRVLFFDVFGTCEAQRGPVADELWKAAQQELGSTRSSMCTEVRAKATDMWFELGGEWNKAEEEFIKDCKNRGGVDWQVVDQRRIEALPKLLAQRGLVILREDASASGSILVVGGSLWSESQLQHLGRVWHRLAPWPDTIPGLELLNKKYATVALSNTYTELLEKLVAHSNAPFKDVYSAEMFHSFKPSPKVYLRAAEKMGVKPEECAMVAAHLGDLKAAKECGFYAIYVERPLEEKAPELRKENIPDLVIREEEDGFLALAARLGIHTE